MKKRILPWCSGLFGLGTVLLGSLFGITWFFVAWITMFAIMGCVDLYYCKKNEKKFFLKFTPWAVVGGMLATMAYAVITGINEQ